MAHRPFPALTITTALTGDTSIPEMQTGHISDAVFTAKFNWGSGGTTAKVYIQTTFDGGVSWVDIACFAFTTAIATKVSAVKSTTVVAAAYVPTDGTLADDTIKDGLLGHRFRVKVTTTGTYAGNTSLLVTVYSRPVGQNVSS